MGEASSGYRDPLFLFVADATAIAFSASAGSTTLRSQLQLARGVLNFPEETDLQIAVVSFIDDLQHGVQEAGRELRETLLGFLRSREWDHPPDVSEMCRTMPEEPAREVYNAAVVERPRVEYARKRPKRENTPTDLHDWQTITGAGFDD